MPTIHITLHFLDPSFSVDLSLTFNCKITTVFLLQKSETKIYPILSLLPILEYIRQKSSPSLSPGPNEPKSNTKSILHIFGKLSDHFWNLGTNFIEVRAGIDSVDCRSSFGFLALGPH